MKILLLADKEQKEELIPVNKEIDAVLIWSDNLTSVQNNGNADACIDLLFDDTAERISQLRELQPAIIIVNSVVFPFRRLGTDIIRINGWKTFLKGQVIEASGNDTLKTKAATVFSAINKQVEWVPDIEGFISARVVASIINEAYYALEEKVSTAEQIDTAMKLGTNYPYGPFEWSKKIGLQNIHKLLQNLASGERRYEPSLLLAQEALA